MDTIGSGRCNKRPKKDVGSDRYEERNVERVWLMETPRSLYRERPIMECCRGEEEEEQEEDEHKRSQLRSPILQCGWRVCSPRLC